MLYTKCTKLIFLHCKFALCLFEPTNIDTSVTLRYNTASAVFRWMENQKKITVKKVSSFRVGDQNTYCLKYGFAFFFKENFYKQIAKCFILKKKKQPQR